jgi:small subunit ribosomal protein S10
MYAVPHRIVLVYLYLPGETRLTSDRAHDPAEPSAESERRPDDATALSAERLRLFKAETGASSTTDTIDPSPEQQIPSLLALYMRPLRREAKHGVPSCDLQLRSFNPRSIEFFADFALRAAYYLGLPASGPVPLPRKVERWTVPKSHFIFKKSQENFERITYKRLIQIQDGSMEAVYAWLAYLQKRAIGGVGMKANVWEFSSLGM